MQDNTTENEAIHDEAPVAIGPWPELSPREIQVAEGLARGLTNSEIATAMGKISVKTIDTHRGHVMKKLGLKNNVQLCLLAVRRGGVKP